MKKGISLGCGLAGASMQFLVENRADFEFIGVDIDPEVKPDIIADITKLLPFKDEEFDLVYASHIIEHINNDELWTTLAEWIRILKVDGYLEIYIPDITWACQKVIDGKIKDYMVLQVLYGSQENKWQFHKIGFTLKSLRDFVEGGFPEMEYVGHGYEPGEHNYNLGVKWKKGKK